MLFSCSLNGARCRVLMDTGADKSFADADWLAQLGFTQVPASTPLSVITATSQQLNISSVVHAKLRFRGNISARATLYPLPGMLPGVQVILGMDWLRSHGAMLDLGANHCTILRAGVSHKLTPNLCCAHAEWPCRCLLQSQVYAR